MFSFKDNSFLKLSPPGFFVHGSVAYGQCVVDDSSRLLDHQRDFRGSLTPDRCIRYCSEQRFRFAGVQFSYQCFCGNNPPPHSKIVPQTECNKICEGDRNQFCGGTWRNNVFGTGKLFVIVDQEIFPHNNFIQPMSTVRGLY